MPAASSPSHHRWRSGATIETRRFRTAPRLRLARLSTSDQPSPLAIPEALIRDVEAEGEDNCSAITRSMTEVGFPRTSYSTLILCNTPESGFHEEIAVKTAGFMV